MDLFWWWPFGKVPEVSASRLLEMLRQDDAMPQLIDVREPHEWRSGHIAGAVNVPITQFGSRIAEVQLDPQRPIIAICRSAHRSIPAVRQLRKQGFNNVSQLQGGMLAWWKADLPCEKQA